MGVLDENTVCLPGILHRQKTSHPNGVGFVGEDQGIAGLGTLLAGIGKEPTSGDGVCHGGTRIRVEPCPTPSNRLSREIELCGLVGQISFLLSRQSRCDVGGTVVRDLHDSTLLQHDATEEAGRSDVVIVLLLIVAGFRDDAVLVHR